MPRHFGRPSGPAPENGCGIFLLVVIGVWVGVWVLSIWDKIW